MEDLPVEDERDSEPMTATTVPVMGEITENEKPFEINRFFNDLPIRILGSHEFPAFYLTDIAAILKIKDPRTSVRNFDPIELVSSKEREEHGIKAYRRYKNTLRVEPKTILLSEFGVYRLIMNSKSELAEHFRKFLYDVLYELRTKGRYEMQAELEKLRITHEENIKTIADLRWKQERFKNLTDKIYVYEIQCDPKLNKQLGLLPEDMSEPDLMSEHEGETEEQWLKRFYYYYELHHPQVYKGLSAQPGDPIYKLTTSVLDITHPRYSLVHYMYCRNAAKIIETIQLRHNGILVGTTGCTFHISKADLIKIVEDEILLE